MIRFYNDLSLLAQPRVLALIRKVQEPFSLLVEKLVEAFEGYCFVVSFYFLLVYLLTKRHNLLFEHLLVDLQFAYLLLHLLNPFVLFGVLELDLIDFDELLRGGLKRLSPQRFEFFVPVLYDLLLLRVHVLLNPEHVFKDRYVFHIRGNFFLPLFDLFSEEELNVAKHLYLSILIFLYFLFQIGFLNLLLCS